MAYFQPINGFLDHLIFLLFSLSINNKLVKMAHQNSQGIQTLLDAEKEAAKIVQKARQYRVQRLKDARTEAAKEIEELKAQKKCRFPKI